MSIKKIVILFNELSENAKQDELDILDQVELAENSLLELGYETSRMTLGFDIPQFLKEIQIEKPDMVFNLVESIQNHGEQLYFATALLNYLKIPYTGVRNEGMFITTNKPLAKHWMRNSGIPTASWFELDELDKLDSNKTYLVKPKLEDGSLGFDDDLVFKGSDQTFHPKIKTLSKNNYFIEEYIDGREFNISVLGGNQGPEVLPIPEMMFIDFPSDKPKIMGYRAKWEEGSFEYENTARQFIDEKNEQILVEKLKNICIDCWKTFSLSGYVRVDFRVDKEGNPFVLEVNANPCITPGSGFYMACEQTGYTFTDATKRIIEDAKAYFNLK